MTEDDRLEAARWADRIAGAGDAADRRRYDRWSESPGGAAAYTEMARVRRLASDAADTPALQAFRREALSRAARRSFRASIPWPGLALVAAAAAGLAISIPAVLHQWRAPPPPAATTYATAVGQRLAVALDDGSRVTLDTASRVRVVYSATERRLVLESGQAMFEVAKRQTRPFIVSARGREVIAHGTAFDVRLDPDRLRVALIEGKVSVATPGGGAVAMSPADVLTSSATGMTLRRDRAAVDAITSWSAGRVEAEDQPLAEVAAEMNRYTARPIVVDPSAATLRISGSFRAGEAGSFLDALQLGFPVEVSRRADGVAVVKRRG